MSSGTRLSENAQRNPEPILQDPRSQKPTPLTDVPSQSVSDAVPGTVGGDSATGLGETQIAGLRSETPPTYHISRSYIPPTSNLASYSMHSLCMPPRHGKPRTISGILSALEHMQNEEREISSYSSHLGRKSVLHVDVLLAHL